MGQYYAIHNIDKKETLRAIASGVKLLEMSSDWYTMSALAVLLANSNGRGGGDLYVETERYSVKTGKTTPIKGAKAKAAAVELISGRWAGDRIVIQGDYAQVGDPGFLPELDLREFTDITQLCVDALRAAGTDIDGDQGFQITKRFGRLA